MPNSTQHFLDLLVSMTEKEFRVRYKYTVFGFLWLILLPVLQMLVIGFIFTFFIKQPVAHYNFHLFIGLLVWNFFSLSLNKTTPSIVFERSLIKKASFPHAVIPLSIILSNFINFLLALILYFIAILFLGTFSLVNVFYLLIGLTQLFAFTMGLSLLTSSLNVRFRDVAFFVQAILIIWFYATPIIYSLTMVPARLFWLWRLNPLTSTLQFLQNAFLGEPLPGLAMIGSNLLIIIVIIILGILVFNKESRNFDDWL